MVGKAMAAVVAQVPDPGMGQAPPGSQELMTLLGWVAWIVFGLCVAGLLIGAGYMAIEHQRHGGGGQVAGQLVKPMVAAVVAASASGFIGVLTS